MATSLAEISKQIYMVRGTQVMLDCDLAAHYQTDTRTLNQTVGRHLRKFPEDFMFRVTKGEFENLKSQIVTSKTERRGGRRKPPLVFTEQGVGMLSCVMNDATSIEFSVLAMRAFGQVRQTSDSQNILAKKVENLESILQEFKQIFARLEGKIDTYFGSTHKYQHSLSVHEVSENFRHPILFADKTQVDEIEDILVVVAKYFGIGAADLKTTTRVKSVVVPRQIAIYLIRKRVGIGFREIGKCFAGKDHTTVLHAYRRMSEAVCKSGLIRDSITVIENALHTGVQQRSKGLSVPITI